MSLLIILPYSKSTTAPFSCPTTTATVYTRLYIGTSLVFTEEEKSLSSDDYPDFMAKRWFVTRITFSQQPKFRCTESLHCRIRAVLVVLVHIIYYIETLCVL